MVQPSAKRGGLLLILSSPSGAGKTTLCRRLMQTYPEVRFSVSYTTRPPRKGEIDGVDYHFVSDAVFDKMIEDQAFAEWALVHGRRYGTTVRAVKEALDSGSQMIFDIDYQGAERLAELFPKDALLCFVLPPSMEVLEARLSGRGTDAPEVVAQRLRNARTEIAHYRSYHYLVINDEVEQAYRELEAVYLVERAKAKGQAAPDEVVALARRCNLSQRSARAEALIPRGNPV